MTEPSGKYSCTSTGGSTRTPSTSPAGGMPPRVPVSGSMKARMPASPATGTTAVSAAEVAWQGAAALAQHAGIADAALPLLFGVSHAQAVEAVAASAPAARSGRKPSAVLIIDLP